MNHFGDADDRLGDKPKSLGHVLPGFQQPSRVTGTFPASGLPAIFFALRGGKGAHAAMHFFWGKK